jgi:hypothetical protein
MQRVLSDDVSRGVEYEASLLATIDRLAKGEMWPDLSKAQFVRIRTKRNESFYAWIMSRDGEEMHLLDLVLQPKCVAMRDATIRPASLKEVVPAISAMINDHIKGHVSIKLDALLYEMGRIGSEEDGISTICLTVSYCAYSHHEDAAANELISYLPKLCASPKSISHGLLRQWKQNAVLQYAAEPDMNAFEARLNVLAKGFAGLEDVSGIDSICLGIETDRIKRTLDHQKRSEIQEMADKLSQMQVTQQSPFWLSLPVFTDVYNLIEANPCVELVSKGKAAVPDLLLELTDEFPTRTWLWANGEFYLLRRQDFAVICLESITGNRFLDSAKGDYLSMLSEKRRNEVIDSIQKSLHAGN